MTYNKSTVELYADSGPCNARIRWRINRVRDAMGKSEVISFYLDVLRLRSYRSAVALKNK